MTEVNERWQIYYREDSPIKPGEIIGTYDEWTQKEASRLWNHPDEQYLSVRKVK